MKLHRHWRKGQRSGIIMLYGSKNASALAQVEVDFLSGSYGFGVQTDNGDRYLDTLDDIEDGCVGTHLNIRDVRAALGSESGE